MNKLATKLVALDLETTSTDVATARIVEIAICSAEGRRLAHRVNPDCPIPPEASAVHGITDADVLLAPSFEMIAPQVQRWVTDAVLVSYNGRSFDVPILDRELRQAGQAGIDLEQVQEIDLFRFWKEIEPRTLEAAMFRWAGVRLEDAHSAAADAASLFEIIRGIQNYDPDATFQRMIEVSRPADEVDRSGKLRRREDGVIVFNFGKHNDEPVLEHLDYVDWMLGADFPPDTRKILLALRRRKQWNQMADEAVGQTDLNLEARR